jgi:hypothetical protein
MTTTTSRPRANIFFAGTVHEAITTSVQQRYALVCFVTDGGEESSIWESEYLIDAEVNQTADSQRTSLLFTRSALSRADGVEHRCLDCCSQA